MHKILLSTLAILLLGTYPVDVCAWGPAGHQLIGGLADEMLTDNARHHVADLLGPDLDGLKSIASWPDCARDVQRKIDGSFKYLPDPKYHTALCDPFAMKGDEVLAMEDYVGRNWVSCAPKPGEETCHKQYHFTDVSIKHSDYGQGDTGTSDHDVVHAVTAAIAVLQGQPSPAPFAIRDQREALLLLTHFVGDIHQPLHVGAVYLNSANKSFNPDAAGAIKVQKVNETLGGNRMEDIAGKSFKNLHAEWDGISSTLEWTTLNKSAHDQLLASAKSVPKSGGDMLGWSASWASETVIAAKDAYKGLTYTHDGAQKPGDWTVSFPDKHAYAVSKALIQKRQLAKAAARLAQVLNSIWP